MSIERQSSYAQDCAVVFAYERSIGRPWRRAAVSRLTEAGVAHYAALCRAYLAFGSVVDRALDRDLPIADAIPVARSTPGALVAAGLPDLPLLHTPAHLMSELSAQSTGYSTPHALPPQTMKRLPELLGAPCAIIPSSSRSDTVLALLDEADGRGDPLIAAIAPGVRFEGRSCPWARRGDPVNFLLSIYGSWKIGAEISRSAGQGTCLMLDRDRTDRLLERCCVPPLHDRSWEPRRLIPVMERTGAAKKDRARQDRESSRIR